MPRPAPCAGICRRRAMPRFAACAIRGPICSSTRRSSFALTGRTAPLERIWSSSTVMVAGPWFRPSLARWGALRDCAKPSPANSPAARSQMAGSTLPKPKGWRICSRLRPRASGAPRLPWPRAGFAGRSKSGSSACSNCRAEAELAIDYVGEEDADEAPSFAPRARALQGELQAWLDRPRIEPLRDGVRVVIAGPPNAGKSSLLNALVGHERAIVSAQAGTTRDHIDVPISIGGVPILLTDTAGLRSSGDEIEGQGITRAEQLVDSADLVLWLGSEDLRASSRPSIQIFPKADLGESAGEGINVSSRTGQGLAELIQGIAAEAKALLPAEGAIAINARQADCDAMSPAMLCRSPSTRIRSSPPKDSGRRARLSIG